LSPPRFFRAETIRLSRYYQEERSVPRQLTAADRNLERYQAYLQCLTYIQIDPRLWQRFGWSDIVNHTLLEAHREMHLLEALDEADRNRRLRRMLLNNLLERIEREQAKLRDYRREEPISEALAGSSCSLQEGLVDERDEAIERGVRLAEALAQLPEREREALILQKYHGLTLAQIAEHLNCTPGTVAGLHARGLKRLRQLLSDPGIDEE
jgi:RNA polymerase sigma-70 factor (ECF subfamily)